MTETEATNLACILVLVERATDANVVKYLTQPKLAEWGKESLNKVRQKSSKLAEGGCLKLRPPGRRSASVYSVTPKGKKFIEEVRAGEYRERIDFFGNTDDPLKHCDELAMPSWKSKNRRKDDDEWDL